MDKSTSKQIRAVRGAITVGADDRDEIVAATAELLREVLVRNDATPDDVVSVIFTATPDLTAAFPAAAARELGMEDVPLLCASEIPVEGALPRCVRVMMHLITPRPRGELQHVYLGGARELRADLFR
ncbi:MAG: chorismate mutase [Actinomycetota bacterium]